MKTFKELFNEVLSLSQRKAIGRRMKILSKKSSTKMRKKMNKMRSLTPDKAKQRAQKSVRKTIMQKIVGKGKDLATMSAGQKANIEKKTDKRMKTMGARVQALVKKTSKQMVKKHRDAKAAMMKKPK
jgi:hypothetical protein|tara:strand:+ start:175 stop:555 length:381 start_codon:yes stop_codon:yes gene_type:complete